MNREVALLEVDVLIRAGFGVWAIVCLRYLYKSLRRGHVFINGQAATRQAEPVGFWLVVTALVGVVCLSFHVVVSGL